MVKSLPYLFTDNNAHDLLQYTVLIEKKMKYCAILAARLPLPLPNCQKMLSMVALSKRLVAPFCFFSQVQTILSI